MFGRILEFWNNLRGTEVREVLRDHPYSSIDQVVQDEVARRKRAEPVPKVGEKPPAQPEERVVQAQKNIEREDSGIEIGELPEGGLEAYKQFMQTNPSVEQEKAWRRVYLQNKLKVKL